MTAYSPAPVSDGKTLGIVGVVLAFVFAPAGLVVSLIARRQSRAAGLPNTAATAGIVLSIIFIVLWILLVIGLFATGALVYFLYPQG